MNVFILLIFILRSRFKAIKLDFKILIISIKSLVYEFNIKNNIDINFSFSFALN